MGTSKKSLLTKFLIWRIKHISQKQFVLLLSMVVGLLSGLGAVLIKNLTYLIQNLLEGRLISNYHSAFYFVFPLLGVLITALFMRYILRHTVSHGIPSTLYAISKKKGIIRRFQMFGSLIAAPITVGFGGSVGLEGPTVATGAALSSNLARLLHLNQATRTLLIGCAAAGAMSSIFKAPIAAIIFAVEVFSLDLTLMSLVPLLLASVTAIITSYFFFGNDILLPFTVVDTFSIGDIPFYLILAVVAGLVSIYFTNTYEWIQKRFDRIPNKWHRMLVGGTLIGVLVYCIPPLYGEGFDVINNLVQGNANLALENNLFNASPEHIYITIGLLVGLVLFKIIASALTFGAGGVGGIFAPTLFMGSIMGYTVAIILRTIGFDSANISISNFTLVGMAGLMAGVLHAPLTAIFLIAELTGGYALFIPLMITSAVAYSITKYVHPHSVYTMELGRKGELITHNKDHAVLTLMDLESVVERNFIALEPDMNLGEIVSKGIVKSNRNIFPVVAPESGQLRGIILLDDLRPVMFERQLYQEISARDLMQDPASVVELDKDRMTDVMKKFQDTGAWNLPVVRSGVYNGFVSKSKLLTVYRRKLIDFSGAS